MFKIKNLLKVALICLCLGCFGATRVSATNINEIKSWYDKKKQMLNIQHPTAEEKAAVDAAKKEWDEKSRTMTDDEYQDAFDEWWNSLPTSLWTKLDPETSTDDDVRAAASDDYIWQAIYDYADSQHGQVKAPEQPAPEQPAAEEDPVSDFVAPMQPAAEEPASPYQWGNNDNQWNPQYGGTEDNSGADVVVPYAPGAAPTATTKVTTNENGKITTEETSGTVGPKGDTPTGATADTPTTGTPAQDAKPTEDKKPEEEKKPEDNTVYSGVYKGHQLIPNLMALHCKVNAEDIVKDLSLMEKCVRQYLTEMNNQNAAAKEEAMRDYNNLRYAVINDNLAVAMTKAASIAGYEEKMNEYAEATSNTDTKYDTEVAVAYTQAFSTDVMNSIRELYVEMIKYEAINGLIDVDPKAILEDEETSAKEKYMADLKTNADGTTITAETNVGEIKEGTYLGDNQCEVNGVKGPCADGTYKDQYGNLFTCTDGLCVNGGSAEGVVVIGDKKYTRAELEAKLKEYENMSPEEFARHRDEFMNLKAKLTVAMTAADATDEQIATAQMGLERMEQILQENAAQKAASDGEDTFVPVDDGGSVINAESDANVKNRLANMPLGDTFFPSVNAAISHGASDNEISNAAQNAKAILEYLQSLPADQQTDYVKKQIADKQKILAACEDALKQREQQRNQEASQQRQDEKVNGQSGEQATPPVDPNDKVAVDLAGRSDADLNYLYNDTKRDQEELSDTIFQMQQIKEKWQQQNKWSEKDEADLKQKMYEYKEMQEYQKKIEAEMGRRNK